MTGWGAGANYKRRNELCFGTLYDVDKRYTEQGSPAVWPLICVAQAAPFVPGRLLTFPPKPPGSGQRVSDVNI